MSDKIQIIKIDNPLYPGLLKQIFDPPETLYCRGNLAVLKVPALAIVGSRNATSYGKKHTERISADLARMGFCVVSGLAYGVDSWAHQAALTTGQSIAVIAGGLDYPLMSWQRTIAKKILAQGGAIVSESPGKTPALKYHFPLRNRIIAGLSYGTIVIEARKKSGALITAKAALDSNRLVFAMPGDIDRPTSAGTLNLIIRGASPIRCALDIKKELINQLPPVILNSLAKNSSDIIIEQLSKSHKTAQELASRLQEPASKILALLSRLELEGQIYKKVDDSYALNI